jgi:hypothetical protein
VRAGSGGALAAGAEAVWAAGGNSPVTTLLAEITVLGSSTIFSAETRMPFLSSNTVAGLPSTMNL